MKYTHQLAKHLKDVYFGGNWTCSNLQDLLQDVDRREALAKIGSLNTIAVLTYHIHYYVKAITRVLEGKPLEAHDTYSFDCPVITTDEEWEIMKASVLQEAQHLSGLIEELPDEKLGEHFTEEKYGSYIRNFMGLIEHTHYHLGQVAILKKLIKEKGY